MNAYTGGTGRVNITGECTCTSIMVGVFLNCHIHLLDRLSESFFLLLQVCSRTHETLRVVREHATSDVVCGCHQNVN